MRIPRLVCKYVSSVGVEVECGIPTREGVAWVEAFERSDEMFVYGSDGSVSVPGCWDSDAELRYWVYVPEEWGRFVTVLRWLWEEIGIKQNSSCGNHVHVRMKDYWMQPLIHPRFVKYFQRSYLNFASKQSNPQKYIARARSTYSAFYTWRSYQDLENQVRESYQVSGSRYRSINYWSLHDSQRTLEFRIMPWAENFEEHLNMILFIVRTVERYCNSVRKGKIELSCSETTFSPVVTRLNATVFLYTRNEEVEPQVVEMFQPQQLEVAEVEVVTIM
jgi:8-oxo-dGTP pyrophosphatase MutT (NUDIX family)